jgi:hypothetical protein
MKRGQNKPPKALAGRMREREGLGQMYLCRFDRKIAKERDQLVHVVIGERIASELFL